MSDVMLPPALSIARNRFRYLDATGISRSPYGGVTRSAALLGDRVGASLDISPAGGGSSTSQQARAALLAFIGQLQGRQNRAMLWDHAYAARGSFPDDELQVNNDFSNGTTSWTDQGNVDAVVADGVYRIIRTANDGTGSGTVAALQAHTLTQFVPYLYRYFVLLDGGLTNAQIYRVTVADGGVGGVYANIYPGGLASNSGMRSALIIPGLTGSYNLGVFCATTTDNPLDFESVLWASAARCMLADCQNNVLLQSDDFTTTWTNSNSTDAANSTTAPDGTATADSIIEDATASAVHGVTQTVTVNVATGDVCFSVCLKAGTRTWALLSVSEVTGGTQLNQYYNLATGAAGAAANGANWSNPRTYAVALGNGWWRYYILGRKTSAAGTVNFRVYLATADNVGSYNGDGASLIYAWRAGASPGGGLTTLANVAAGVPSVPVKTTTTSSSAAPTGNTMRVKGCPVSTNGLLLPGDWVELQTSRGSELKMVTSALNSDAAGCAVLNFAPRLRGTMTDGTPISVNRPMGRFIFTGDAAEWGTEPGILSAASFDFEEAT